MNTILKVSEVIENLSHTSEANIKAQIKITNTSDSYINNLKLIIEPKEIAILEQCIIRQRGSLSFDPIVNNLEVGNLAPDESAYFEYAFKPSSSAASLLDQMHISYTPERSNKEISTQARSLLIETPILEMELKKC
ncbi:MAG: hypothetical protein K0S30_2411 [Clostridia bacterium]|jgi:heme oxygenase|nr:hypothetical protein [Clostridia bacterium]